MSSKNCDTSLILFIANVLEQAEFHDDHQVCDYGERWFLDLLDEFGLYEPYAMKSGIAEESRGEITERLPIVLTGSSSEAVAARVKFDRFMQEAYHWHQDGHRNNSLWLYHMLAGEFGPRRSLIYAMSSNDSLSGVMPTDSYHMPIDPEIVRHHLWETPDISVFDDKWVNGDAPFVFDPQPWGTAQHLPPINGTDDARIAIFEADDRATGRQIGNPLLTFGDLGFPQNYFHSFGHVWAGIKEDIGCGTDQFDPIVNFEAASADIVINNGVSANFGDPDACNGLAARRDNICDDTEVRMTVSLADALPNVTNFEQYRGQYIVLARMRSGGTNANWEVSLEYGWPGFERKVPGDEHQYVKSEKYAWYPLGVMDLPSDDARQATSHIDFDNLEDFELQLVTRSTLPGLTGDELYIDCLQLIPYEHHFVLHNADSDDPVLVPSDFNQNRFRTFTHEDDTTSHRYYIREFVNGFAQNWKPLDDLSLIQHNFYYPVRGGAFVMAQNTLEVEYSGIQPCEVLHDKDRIVRIRPRNECTWTHQWRMCFYERWLSLRDA